MSTICAEQHKLYPSQSQHQHFVSPKKTFKDLELPPRKLLITKKSYHHPQESPDMSPYYDHFNLHKFLPCNDTNEKDGVDDDDDDDDDDDMDPYSSDHFRMYEFKVRRCTRSRSHDWTECPFAHPGEKARRRDPKKYHYSGAVCPDFKRGGCSRGDNCGFSHGVFECWLHPSRYRTEACKDGKNCKRKVCFFAHSPRQLRILPEVQPRKYDNAAGAAGLVSPCSFVKHGHCCCLGSHSVTSSPTSTLLGLSHLSPPLSPSLSPPLSPVKQRSLNGFSPILRYGDRLSKLSSGAISHKDVLTELITSLEALNFNESAAVNSPLSTPPAANHRNINIPWNIDAYFDAAELEDPQQQFILSPSTPSPSSGGKHANFFSTGDCSSHKLFLDDSNNGGGMACPDPDLGWVNDLLM